MSPTPIVPYHLLQPGRNRGDKFVDDVLLSSKLFPLSYRVFHKLLGSPLLTCLPRVSNNAPAVLDGIEIRAVSWPSQDFYMWVFCKPLGYNSGCVNWAVVLKCNIKRLLKSHFSFILAHTSHCLETLWKNFAGKKEKNQK